MFLNIVIYLSSSLDSDEDYIIGSIHFWFLFSFHTLAMISLSNDTLKSHRKYLKNSSSRCLGSILVSVAQLLIKKEELIGDLNSALANIKVLQAEKRLRRVLPSRCWTRLSS